MIRKLTATTLIGALALGVFARLQAPMEPTVQMPAELAFRSVSIRDLFP